MQDGRLAGIDWGWWLQERRLLDMYARSDITALAKGNSYGRLQWEEVTVGQALSLSTPWPQVRCWHCRCFPLLTPCQASEANNISTTPTGPS